VVCRLAAALTCLVLWKWVRVDSMRDSLLLGVAWSAIAIACDYVFLVKLLNPPDGYYKFDVYLYYLLLFALPLRPGRDAGRSLSPTVALSFAAIFAMGLINGDNNDQRRFFCRERRRI